MLDQRDGEHLMSFSVEHLCAEVESPGYKSSLLIDSASEIHVCPPSYCAKFRWTDHRNVVALCGRRQKAFTMCLLACRSGL
eukprot:1283612-Amphidinium_carterae.4